MGQLTLRCLLRYFEEPSLWSGEVSRSCCWVDLMHAPLSVEPTVVLVRGLQVVSVAQQGADRLSQTVLVGLLGPLIQQGVGHQARVTPVLHVLRTQWRAGFVKKSETILHQKEKQKQSYIYSIKQIISLLQNDMSFIATLFFAAFSTERRRGQ